MLPRQPRLRADKKLLSNRILSALSGCRRATRKFIEIFILSFERRTIGYMLRLHDWFPLSYEVFSGNRADVTNLEEMLGAVERRHGVRNEFWRAVPHFMADFGRSYLRPVGAGVTMGGAGLD